MHFTGVPLQTLIQVGALAGAAVVVFYILKLRRRPVAVPFSKIWQKILRDKEATSLFSQLKRLLCSCSSSRCWRCSCSRSGSSAPRPT